MAALPEIDAFTHDHVFLGAAHDDNARRTLWVVALTAGMMVVEIIAGYLTGSMALLADGFHMATHAGALGVAAAAYAYAKRHASSRAYSFGTGKVGDLAGFASAMVLGLIALGIGVESILRLFQPITVAFGEATLIAVVSWKGVGYWMVFLLAGLLAIPKELDEAAGLDGATAWQRLRYVTLPMMRRPLAFVLVADTAANFLLFAPVYVITHGGPNGATHLLMFESYQSAFAFLNHGRSLAISTVILLIILVTALFEMRLFRQKEGEA